MTSSGYTKYLYPFIRDYISHDVYLYNIEWKVFTNWYNSFGKVNRLWLKKIGSFYHKLIYKRFKERGNY